MSIGIVFEKTIDLVQDLGVADIDLQWIEDVTASNFCEINGLPISLSENAKERNFFILTLNELNKISRCWIEIEDTNREFNIFILFRLLIKKHTIEFSCY